MTYPTGEPWGGSLYRGPSAPAQPPRAAPPPPARRRIPTTTLVGAGVAVALALGVGFGMLARPDLAARGAAAPMRAVTPAPDAAPSAGRMNIEINPAAPTPVVASAGKLEVLPPGMAGALPPPPAAPRPLPVRPASAFADDAPPPLAAPQPVPAQVASRDQACGFGSPAARMVCADPQLAAADREMTRAYRRALRTGVPAEQLGADQRDWLAAREEAARRSPGAVASVYDQRIEELNQLIEDGPG